MKSSRNFLALLLLTVMLFNVLTVTSAAAEPAQTYGVSNEYVGETAISTAALDEGVSAASTATASGYCGSNLDWVLNGSTLTISGTGAMYNYEIGSRPTWYSYRNSITRVVIEEGATSIGTRAFSNMDNLQRVTIASTVKKIGEWAFYDCPGLTSVLILGDVTLIDRAVFHGDSSLETLVMAGKVGTIEFGAFEECYLLTDVYYALSSSAKPEIKSYNDCLLDATWHYNTLGSGKCGTNISWTLNSAGTLRLTGSGEMYNYSNSSSNFSPWYDVKEAIKAINVGAGITTIGNYAFWDCVNATQVSLPSGVQRIGNYAFCKVAATTIPIPKAVTYIGNGAFGSCPRLTSCVIPSRVTYLGDYVCMSAPALTTVLIPKSVTTIGKAAFMNCAKLTDVTLSSGLTTLGEAMFAQCTSLTSISIPNGVTAIPKQAFAACSALTSVSISGTVKEIGDGAFFEAGALRTVTIPDSVTTISQRAFMGCTSLSKVVLSSNLTSLGSYAFNSCSGLSSVTIPDSLTELSEGVFGSCGLSSISIPGSITYIKNYAFAENGSLHTVTFEGNAPEIVSSAFLGVTADAYYPQNDDSWAYNRGNYGGSLTWYTYAPAPTNVIAKNNQTTGRIKLEWSAVENAAGYNIYRASTANGTYTKLNATPVTGTTYTDGRSGNAGNTYFYKITTVSNGKESGYSKVVSRCAMCGAPVDMEAVYSGGNIALSWAMPSSSPSGSVSYYIVYKWNGSGFEKIATTSKTSYTVSGSNVTAGKNQFSVRAVNKNNPNGSISKYASAAVITLENGPKGLTLSNNLTTGRIKLVWNAVSGADSYNVYRATSQNGEYTLLNSTAKPAYNDNSTGNAGKTYYYKVTAVISGKETACSAGSRCSMCERPTGLTATQTSDGIQLNWNYPQVSPRSSVSYYLIYRYDSVSNAWSRVATKSVNSYLDQAVTPGVTYTYRLRAANSANASESISIYSLTTSLKYE